MPGRSGIRQQQRGQEPAGAGAANGDVVGVHLQRVPPGGVGGERDRIRRRDQVAITQVDDGGVLSDARADDDAGIPDGVLVEDRLQRLGTELPDWQDAHARPVVYGFFAC